MLTVIKARAQSIKWTLGERRVWGFDPDLAGEPCHRK
jgi:hypothetical protein